VKPNLFKSIHDPEFFRSLPGKTAVVEPAICGAT
jgi:hypothetical protein